jgi:hypothetical protein
LALNRKLTPLIAGRTIKSAVQADTVLNIVFGDGSTLRVKTAGTGTAAIPADAAVKAVRQKVDTLTLDFADGSSAAIKLAEATSSVMLRDSAGVLEYAD